MSNFIMLDVPTITYLFMSRILKVKLHRFDNRFWIVNYGWFDFDGNREICGWYLSDIQTGEVKPLLRTDLDDIYVIE